MIHYLDLGKLFYSLLQEFSFTVCLTDKTWQSWRRRLLLTWNIYGAKLCVLFQLITITGRKKTKQSISDLGSWGPSSLQKDFNVGGKFLSKTLGLAKCSEYNKGTPDYRNTRVIII